MISDCQRRRWNAYQQAMYVRCMIEAGELRPIVPLQAIIDAEKAAYAAWLEVRRP